MSDFMIVDEFHQNPSANRNLYRMRMRTTY